MTAGQGGAGDGSPYDAIVIGGGPAGLSAGLTLGRSRRRTLIVDAGRPRNAASPAAHGVITNDGVPPSEILAAVREELAGYPSVELRRGEVVDASGAAGEFRVELADGSHAWARRLILAVGVRDELPPIEGLHENWGTGVLHCMYCHGYEVADQPLAVLAPAGAALDRAATLLNWTSDVIFCLQGDVPLDPDDRARLEEHGILIQDSPLVRVEGGAPDLELVFADGSREVRTALLVASTLHLASGIPDRLGCERNGADLVVGEDRQTTVPGVYAAGDIAAAKKQVMVAAATGAEAAMMLNGDLCQVDFGGEWANPICGRR